MYQPAQAATGPVVPNHPSAVPMAAIGFINLNVAIACVYGSFSVLLAAAESRLGVGGALATLSMPAVSLVGALSAAVVGMLVGRVSLRLLMLAGSICSTAGFLLLAFTASYPLYLVAFGLLLGPGLGAGTILPNTLVTRWFNSGRGKALGIISTPLAIAIVPLLSNWILLAHGLTTAYLTLAGISAIAVIANFFVQDFPPGSLASTQAATTTDKAAGAPASELLRSTRFWALSLTYCIGSVGAIMFGSHMVPMAKSWGFSATLGATLITITGISGMLGSNLFGWVADRLGGPTSLAILVFDAAVLWLLLVLHPPFIGVAIIAGLLGMHSSGLVPVLSLSFSQVFGPESFSRAYGLTSLIFIPFSALCVPAAAVVFSRTGSYSGVAIGEAALLALTGLLALTARRRKPPIIAPAV